MNMVSFKLYVGLEQDKDGKPLEMYASLDIVRSTVAELSTIKDNFAATVTTGRGYWQGAHETSAIIESIGDPEETRETIQQLAARLKRLLNQECVAVTETPCTLDFI